MTVFYTADAHWGHANILRYVPSRPWPDIEAMNAGLVERWNAAVTPEDTVWVLGDVALSSSKLALVQELNGRKILVAGNHDSCWSGHKKWRGQIQRYLAVGFDEVVETGIVRDHLLDTDTDTDTGIGRPGRVHLAHLPYDGDHTDEDRYVSHRPVDDGTPLLCGHVHDAWKRKRTLRGTPQLNVGVDVRGWTPVSAQALAAELDELLTAATSA